MLDKLSPKLYGIFVADAALTALIAAFIMQYGFGLYPCELCIYQRYPYIMLLAFGAAYSFWTSQRETLTFLITVTLIASIGIAGYHMGVEQGVFEGTSSCSPDSTSGTSLDDLRAMINSAPIASCKDAAAKFLGLSITTWNGFYSLILLIAHLTISKRIGR